MSDDGGSMMMMMVMIGGCGMCCCVAVALVAAWYVLSTYSGSAGAAAAAAGSASGTDAGSCLASACPSSIRGKARDTCLKAAKKTCKTSSTGRSSSGPARYSIGSEKTVYIKATEGAMPYLYNRVGPRMKRCDKYTVIARSASSTGGGAAANDTTSAWSKWRFKAVAGGDSKKPVYTIANVGREGQRCAETLLVPKDTVNCGTDGTDHNGTLVMLNASESGKNPSPASMQGWKMYKDGASGGVWLQHEGCAAMGKSTSWLYMDTSQADLQTVEKEYSTAYLTDRKSATKFTFPSA